MVSAQPSVLVLVAALRDAPIATTNSLLAQDDVSVNVMVVAGFKSALSGLDPRVKGAVILPDMSQDTGSRVSHALNAALSNTRLMAYDYILKADGDAVFPKSFLSTNIRAGFDLMGLGCGLLVRQSAFTAAMSGKFAESSVDDIYLVKCFLARGYKVLPWKWVQPAQANRKPTYDWKRMHAIGKGHYRMGTPFVSHLLDTIYSCRTSTPLYAFLVEGYLNSAIRREPRYPIAADVREHELRVLTDGLKRRLRWR